MVLRYELYEHGTAYIIQIFIRHARARAMQPIHFASVTTRHW